LCGALALLSRSEHEQLAIMISNHLNVLATNVTSALGINKNKSQVTQTEVIVTHGLHTRQDSSLSTISRLKAKHDGLVVRYQDTIRLGKIVAIVASIVSGVLSILIECLMIYVIFKFNTTKEIPIQNRPWGPWAIESVIWPTVMLLIMSLVSAVLAVVSLLGFCYRTKHRVVKFSLALAVAHIAAWMIVAIIYRAEKTSKDLWGWSCTTKASVLADEIGGGRLDFASLCDLQVSLCFQHISLGP
jgi:hypothetical protein